MNLVLHQRYRPTVSNPIIKGSVTLEEVIDNSFCLIRSSVGYVKLKLDTFTASYTIESYRPRIDSFIDNSCLE